MMMMSILRGYLVELFEWRHRSFLRLKLLELIISSSPIHLHYTCSLIKSHALLHYHHHHHHRFSKAITKSSMYMYLLVQSLTLNMLLFHYIPTCIINVVICILNVAKHSSYSSRSSPSTHSDHPPTSFPLHHSSLGTYTPYPPALH